MDFDNRILQYTHILAYRADINERFGTCEAPIDITPGRAPVFNRPIPQRMFKTNNPDTLLLPIIENIIIIILVLLIIDHFINKRYLLTITTIVFTYFYLLKVYY